MREGINLFENFAEITGLQDYDLDLHQQGYLLADHLGRRRSPAEGACGSPAPVGPHRRRMDGR